MLTRLSPPLLQVLVHILLLVVVHLDAPDVGQVLLLLLPPYAADGGHRRGLAHLTPPAAAAAAPFLSATGCCDHVDRLRGLKGTQRVDINKGIPILAKGSARMVNGNTT